MVLCNIRYTFPLAQSKPFPHNTAPDAVLANLCARCTQGCHYHGGYLTWYSSQILSCVSSACGKLKERLMLHFNIPVNRIWYFYWNRRTNWHCASHDFISDLRVDFSGCIDETTFSMVSGHYATPVSAGTTLNIKQHFPCIPKKWIYNRTLMSNDTLQTWDSISGDSPRSWRTYYVMSSVVV